MSIAEIEVEHEDGEIAYIHFSCERRELREIVDEVNQKIIRDTNVEESKIIRQKQTNPVIKTDHTDRIYFRWDEGRVRTNVTMARLAIREAVADYFRRSGRVDGDADLPWDREEMADFAREKIEEIREGKDVGDQPSSGVEGEPRFEEEVSPGEGREHLDEEESRARRRAREDTNHRSETQREPRGGEETSPKGEARIDGNRTSFVPPYSKGEVNYHWAGEGDNVHLDCKDCVHYIEGGGCHMVQGEIDPEGHCEDLYADVGLFARMYERQFEINLAMWGEMFEDRFGNVSFQEIGNKVKEAIRKKL